MKRTIMAGFILTLAIGLNFTFSEQKAYCADCDTSNLNRVGLVYQDFMKECLKQNSAAASDHSKCFENGIYAAIMKLMTAANYDGRYMPGDRALLVGKTQIGNLRAGANRTFQSIAPLDKDTLKVEVNKTDGKNGALVKICSIAENGTQTRIGTLNFAEDSDEKGPKSVTLTGVKGKLLAIEVASFGSAVRKFEYKLTTTQ